MTRLTYTIDTYDRCWQRKLPSLLNHKRILYHLAHSHNDLRQHIQAMGVDGLRSMCLELEIWRTGSLLDGFLFLSSLLLFFGYWPGTNGVGIGFCHLLWVVEFPGQPDLSKGYN